MRKWSRWGRKGGEPRTRDHGSASLPWIVRFTAGPPDPDVNVTTLDAHGRGRVIVVTGAISPTIEGLRLTGGEATGLGGVPWGWHLGGGMYVYRATVPISNSRIYENSAGEAFLPP
jgi:hypothetical protein